MAAIIKRLSSARALLNWLKTVDGSGSGLDADTVDGVHITVGNWTPTLTIVANLDAATANSFRYARLRDGSNDMVFFYGRIFLDPTASTTTTTCRGTLPVASNFTNPAQAVGTFSANTILSSGAITSDATNDQLDFTLISQGTANTGYHCVGGYTVL